MYKEREELLHGSIQAVTFQNPENGYAVLKVLSESGEKITVVGIVPMALPGEMLSATGIWSSHPSYGKQFEAELLERRLPDTEDGILTLISSRNIKGIGEITGRRIVQRFGTDTLEILENHPEQLSEIPGITAKKAAEIGESFRRQVSVRRLVEYMAGHNLPPELALRLYGAFGKQTVRIIESNPYVMAEPEFGGDFTKIDRYALEIGMDGDDYRRVEAGILFELTHNLNNGHTFLPADKLVAAAAQLLEQSAECITESMETLAGEGKIVTDEVLSHRVCYLPELYEAEVYTAERLLSMSAKKLRAPANLSRLLKQAQREAGMEFAENQLQAMEMAAQEQVLLLTGGPGTGKTTTLGGILSVFDAMGLTTLLAAPTGRAAKRLSELTGRDASTIHRLLEVCFSEETGRMSFAHDESEPLKADVVVVDEASMVDLLLMASLLRAIPEKCRLILVGDADQLPSVGAGNVFSDLLRANRLATVRLTEIFRQARESLIVMNAHAVNRGEPPVMSVKNKDFFFIRKTNPAEAAETIRDLCARRLPQNMGIAPEDIQVLTPTRKYETGTYALNKILQGALNPAEIGKREKKFGDFIFREGDRVMQIRNNYDIFWKRVDGFGAGTGIFNGDVGHIQKVDYEQESVTIRFDDREAVYGFDMLNELEPAYAMTVHKSQGSEYRAVILSALQGAPMLLTRSILYTAITRARELLIIVGDDKTIAYMTENNRKSRRYSGLKLRLEQME